MFISKIGGMGGDVITKGCQEINKIAQQKQQLSNLQVFCYFLR